MERNSASFNGLEWENLAAYSDKPIEIQEQVGFSMSSSSGSDLGNGLSSKFPISEESTKQAMDCFGKLGSFPHTYDDFSSIQNVSGASVCSGEQMIGLRLGRPKEYGDSFALTSTKTSISSLPILTTPTKRSRSSYQTMQNPCCQVEGCKLDLKTAKDYHRRHRICESHSKSPKVIVAGMERRFCQQCSRFHDLSEFDDKKRSCRRRLSDHNARRRRVQPESIQLNSAGLSSALYDQRHLLNGLPVSLSNPRWENGGTSMLRQAKDSVIRPSKAGEFEGTLCFSSNDIRNSISNLQMDSDRLSSIHTSNPQVLDQCLHVAATTSTNSAIASDLLSAHSLLSSNSWTLNEGESSSMDGLVQPYHFSLLQTSNVQAEQGTPVSLVHSVNVHNNLQEYQLFKATYDSASFHSTQRNL